MKIYALMAHIIEEDQLLGVFSSQEVADAQKAICDAKGWDAIVAVHEMQLDDYYEDGIARKK